MKSKGFISLSCAILGFLLVLFFLGALLIPRSDVSEANVRRIESGMTQCEVEGILGGPPNCESPLLYEDKRWTCEMWKGRDGYVAVWFDENKQVLRLKWRTEPATDRPWYAQVLLRLG